MNRMEPKKMLRNVVMPGAVLLLVAFAGAHYLFVTRAAAACQVNDKLVNSCRPWLGAFANAYPQVQSGLKNQILYHESRIGRQVELVKDYKTEGGQLGADDKYFIDRADTSLLLTWKPAGSFGSGGGSDASVNGGIDKMADSIKSVAPHKVMLSVWHEPENDVSAGTSACRNANGTKGSPAQYRAMWQNVRNRFDAKGVSNVVWTWIPMGYSGWTCMDKDMYPGNNLVDWIMWDPYGQSDKSTWTGQIGSFYNWMSSNSDASHDFTSKAWGLAEFSTHSSSKAASVAWWNQAKAALDNNTFPKIKAYVVFDANGGKPDNRIMYWCDPTSAGAVVNNHATCGNLQIDTDEQNAYKAFADDPRFTDAFYTNQKPAPDTVKPSVSVASPANNTTVTVGTTERVSVSAADNVGVSKVELYVDGSLQGTQTSSSGDVYTLSWTTTAAGTHMLLAKAYDAAGNVGASTSVSVNVIQKPIPDPGPAPGPSGGQRDPGDINGDHVVNGYDFSVLRAHDGLNYPAADFNHDGVVDGADLVTLIKNWTK